MRTIEKPSAASNCEGLGNNFEGESKGLSVFDNTEKQEKLQSNLMAVMKPSKKIVRLYRCFGCEKSFSLPKMSNCLIICRNCRATAQGKGKIAQTNFTAKTLNNIHGFLRRQFA